MMHLARSLAVGALLAAILPFGAQQGTPFQPPAAAAATSRTGSFGTATIDGIESPGEWSAADVLNLSVHRSPFSGTVIDPRPATLSLMNDGTNLYAAIRVPGPSARMDLELQFDEDHDRTLEKLDDVLAVSVLPTDAAPRDLTLLDRFLHCAVYTSPGCRTDDTKSAAGDPPAGSVDGKAAGGFDGTADYVEIAHPLAGRDKTHDIQTAPGRILGLRLVVKIATGFAQGCPEPTCRWEGGFNTGDLVLATGPAAFTPPAAMAAALRVEGATVTPGAALPGTTKKIAFRVVNRSNQTLVVPSYGRTGRHLAVRIIERIENDSDPGPIGARTPGLEAAMSTGLVSVRGTDVVAALGGTAWPPGTAVTMTTSLSTSNFAAGSYRHEIAIASTTDTATVSSVPVRFELKSVSAEWSANVGTAGRNGKGTLRALSTGDGSLGLSLRNLPARRTYAASIDRGSCAAATTVARAGSVTTSSSGSAAWTLSLSRAITSAVRSAAGSGAIFLRLTSGTSIRCARLSAISLYLGRLAWDVVPLAPDWQADGPTSASGLVVLGSRLLVAGTRWEDRSTNPSVVVWSSTNATDWTRTTLAPSNARIAMAADGQQAVVMAHDNAWRSTDGLTWTAASVPPNVDSPFALPSVTALPGGGFVAALEPNRGELGCQVWSSADGDRWTRLDASGMPSGGCLSLAAGPAGVIATGFTFDGASRWVARSVDGGFTWTKRLSVADGFLRAVMATPGGFLAHGGAVWASTDGASWRRLGTIPVRSGFDGAGVVAIVPFGPGLVGVGGSFVGADTEIADVFVSGNGTPWRLSPLVPAWVGSNMVDAVQWGDRLVVVGDLNSFDRGEESRAVVWVARVTPFAP